MATYNTSQDGNWDNINTWGGTGYPSDGDTATITHLVTYNISDDVNTITTINLNTNGTLQWLGSLGTLVLRYTNMVITGGKLIGKDGTFLRCLGSIIVNNTNESEINMKGSCPNFQTVLTNDTMTGSTFIEVSDSSGFAIGDYISIYDYDNITWDNQTNECFIVNYVSGNNIYLRRFVGREFTLNQDINLGTNVFYTDNDVRPWENGDKFIINDETFIVDNVDIYNKIIYTTENSTTTYISGNTAYDTGIEKDNYSGYTVYKLATSIIDANTENNYIDIGSASGWTIGDVIALGGETYLKSEDITITSISFGGGLNGSDRIEFDEGYLINNHDVGGLVVKVNRDCVFHGNTEDVVKTTSGYIYVLASVANRTFRFENFEMRYYGNNASTNNQGLTIRNSYNRSVILLNISGRHAYKTSGNGRIGCYSYYYYCFLNNVVYDTNYGIGLYSSASHSYCSGNITIKINSIALLWYSYHNCAMEYSIIESTNSYGIYGSYNGYGYGGVVYNGRPANRLWYVRCNYNYNIIQTYSNLRWRLDVYKFYVKNLQNRLFYKELYGNDISIIRNFIIDGTVSTSTSESTSYNRSNSLSIFNQISLIHNYNFISNNVLIKYLYGHLEMDESIRKNTKYSWKATPKSNSDLYAIGIFAIVSAVRGRTIKLGAHLRKDSITNSTVRIDLYDELGALLDSSTLSTTETWEWITLTYEVPKDMLIIVRVGGYGSSGNFWVSNPTIYTDDCLTQLSIMNNFWEKKDPLSTGVRLMNNVKIM